MLFSLIFLQFLTFQPVFLPLSVRTTTNNLHLFIYNKDKRHPRILRVAGMFLTKNCNHLEDSKRKCIFAHDSKTMKKQHETYYYNLSVPHGTHGLSPTACGQQVSVSES